MDVTAAFHETMTQKHTVRRVQIAFAKLAKQQKHKETPTEEPWCQSSSVRLMLMTILDKIPAEL